MRSGQQRLGRRRPTLTAVIPATDGPPDLERCERALRELEEPPEEILVVEEPAEAGPAEARNVGALAAGGDVLVFVDADVLPHHDAFVRIRDAFEADSSLTAIFGAYDDKPEADGAVSTFRNLLPHHVHMDSAGEATTFWSGLGAVKRSRFLAVGGFDAGHFPGPDVEDVDLGMRLAEEGDKLVLDPSIKCKHLKDWTVRGMVRTDLWRRGVPWTVLLLRRRRVPRELNLGHRHRLSAAACLTAVVALAGRRPRVAAGSMAGLIVLNRSLYGLLWRRGGPRKAVAGVGLHAIHHLTAVGAVPLGALAWLRTGALTETSPEALETLQFVLHSQPPRRWSRDGEPASEARAPV